MSARTWWWLWLKSGRVEFVSVSRHRGTCSLCAQRRRRNWQRRVSQSATRPADYNLADLETRADDTEQGSQLNLPAAERSLYWIALALAAGVVGIGVYLYHGGLP